MTDEQKIALPRPREPLNRSADRKAIDRYIAGVLNDEPPLVLERLAIETQCIDVPDKLERSRICFDNDDIRANRIVLEVLDF